MNIHNHPMAKRALVRPENSLGDGCAEVVQGEIKRLLDEAQSLKKTLAKRVPPLDRYWVLRDLATAFHEDFTAEAKETNWDRPEHEGDFPGPLTVMEEE